MLKMHNSTCLIRKQFATILEHSVALSSKGRTCGSEPQNLGSNPSEASFIDKLSMILFRMEFVFLLCYI